ncbi:MAG: hypothetical protein AAGE90_18595, partial [Pseudomonadota bacterium]
NTIRLKERVRTAFNVGRSTVDGMLWLVGRRLVDRDRPFRLEAMRDLSFLPVELCELGARQTRLIATGYDAACIGRDMLVVRSAARLRVTA